MMVSLMPRIALDFLSRCTSCVGQPQDNPQGNLTKQSSIFIVHAALRLLSISKKCLVASLSCTFSLNVIKIFGTSSHIRDVKIKPNIFTNQCQILFTQVHFSDSIKPCNLVYIGSANRANTFLSFDLTQTSHTTSHVTARNASTFNRSFPTYYT